MQDIVKQWWERNGRAFQEQSRIPIDIIYGPGAPNEDALQLIGPVAGKRVLEIGCGGAQASIAFAQRGAIVTGVDIAASEIAFARELARQHGVEITLLQRDMTDLSPIAAESQDIVFSAYAFTYVENLATCFAEVFRVLTPGGLFVWGGEHPWVDMLDGETLAFTRSYFDTGVYVEGADTACPFAGVARTVSDYINLLADAGFIIERLLEPDARPRHPHDPWYGPEKLLAKVPATMIVKARKPAAHR